MVISYTGCSRFVAPTTYSRYKKTVLSQRPLAGPGGNFTSTGDWSTQVEHEKKLQAFQAFTSLWTNQFGYKFIINTFFYNNHHNPQVQNEMYLMLVPVFRAPSLYYKPNLWHNFFPSEITLAV